MAHGTWRQVEVQTAAAAAERGGRAAWDELLEAEAPRLPACVTVSIFAAADGPAGVGGAPLAAASFLLHAPDARRAAASAPNSAAAPSVMARRLALLPCDGCGQRRAQTCLRGRAGGESSGAWVGSLYVAYGTGAAGAGFGLEALESACRRAGDSPWRWLLPGCVGRRNSSPRRGARQSATGRLRRVAPDPESALSVGQGTPSDVGGAFGSFGSQGFSSVGSVERSASAPSNKKLDATYHASTVMCGGTLSGWLEEGGQGQLVTGCYSSIDNLKPKARKCDGVARNHKAHDQIKCRKEGKCNARVEPKCNSDPDENNPESNWPEEIWAYKSYS